MSHHIFNLEELDNFSEKLNLDDLYEKKREHDSENKYLIKYLIVFIIKLN